jgi:subtilisin family serine protease
MIKLSAAAPLLLLFLLAGPAGAAAPAAGVTPGATIDGKVLRALDRGLVGPSAAVVPGQAEVLLRLRRPLPRSPAAAAPVLARLEAAGAALHRAEGHPLYHEDLVPALVTAAALPRLAQLPEVAEISLIPARGPLPLDHSARLLHLAAARGARPAGEWLTGAGVTIADIDTNVDVLHPHFFRADGGYFDWIDTNGDGVLTPGQDAIDLDRDGAAGPKETAQLLRARTTAPFTGEEVGARGAGFDPGLDWLYLDENNNRRRDAGAGFTDEVPAFGEPLFVPDDINRNGKLDVGERVVRLKTSKFRKVFVRLDSPRLSRVFTRDEGLSELKAEYTGGKLYGYADGLHATGVLSILAGDVPLVGRRLVGVAPDAELLLGWEASRQSPMPVAATTWALREGAQVLLYELAPWTGVALDGTDPLSKLIDSSAQKNQVAHVCPVGNIGGGQKHARLQVPAGGAATAEVRLPARLGAEIVYFVQLSLHIRGGQTASVELREPGGTVHRVTPGSMATLSTGALLYPSSELTDRGTYLVDVVLYAERPAQAPLPEGTWRVQVAAPSAVTVDAYVSDNASGFGRGVTLSGATDDRTLAAPSVADACTAVGAHTGHPTTEREPWFYGDEGALEVRGYSARGPRIDGMVQKPDVVAPDNPFAAVPAGQVYGYGDAVIPPGASAPFGGTSGAGPHAAGVAALLWQAGVRGGAIRDALRGGAIAEPVYGSAPNPVAGHGRLSAAGALGRKVPAQAEAPPQVTLIAEPAAVPPGQPVVLRPQIAGQGGRFEVRWDDGYDGTWDTGWGAAAERQVEKPAGKQPYRVRVRDQAGLVAEAVVWVPDGMAMTGCACDALGRGGAPRRTGWTGWAAFALLAFALGAWRRRTR